MTERPLEGRWALILGASSGFGAATGKALASQGMNIAGVHLDLRSTLPNAKAVIADIEAQGVNALFFNTNAIDPDKRAKVLTNLREAMGPDECVHVFMHSLAFGTLKQFIPPLRADGSPGPSEEAIDPAQMDMTFNVMAHSLVYWTQDLVARGMLGRGSRIFSMTSEGSHRVVPNYGAVGAAKAALEAHTRQLAMELGPRGVLVNCIQAGVTDTPALRKIPGNEQMVEVTLRRNPSGRMTRPEDVSSTIAALSNPAVQFVSGSIIFVDGGEDVVGSWRGDVSCSRSCEMPFTIRRANAGDQRAIQALVRSSNINPIGIHWQRFLIAEDAGPEGRRILGIGQVKVHGDGSRELASIATVRDRQGEGIATALIESLLAAEARTSSGPLYLTCRIQMEPFYQRFGFRRVETPAGLPAYFRRLMRLARVFWAIGSLLGRGEGGLIMVRRGTWGVRFVDFTLAIGRRDANGYGVTALGTGLAPVAGALPRPPVSLTAALNRAAGRRVTPDALGKAGALLFDWAFPPPIRSQLRAVRARAEAAGEGLRLRLSLDPPELAAWPWELLHDTDRHDTFAASAATPLVRIYERADRFGAVTEMGAELPIDLLLVLPTTANLDLGAPGSPAGPGADRETAGCAHGGIGKSRPVRSWENLTGPARFRTTRASQTAASRPRTTRAPPP